MTRFISSKNRSKRVGIFFRRKPTSALDTRLWRLNRYSCTSPGSPPSLPMILRSSCLRASVMTSLLPTRLCSIGRRFDEFMPNSTSMDKRSVSMYGNAVAYGGLVRTRSTLPFSSPSWFTVASSREFAVDNPAMLERIWRISANGPKFLDSLVLST